MACWNIVDFITCWHLLDEDQISFSFASSMVDDSIEDYSHQIAEMIGLRNESYLVQAGVRTVLDIGCGFGSLGAHLFQKQLLTMCIANYESLGSQVEITLERGLPEMVASFAAKKRYRSRHFLSTWYIARGTGLRGITKA
ncbi:putative S-adenosyl-L-methionine-dependent methyltransferase [Helianthus annuus]|nr:putative S-adenosyl-L-methionine-dependent methyltransferase [Helianthus annuus]